MSSGLFGTSQEGVDEMVYQLPLVVLFSIIIRIGYQHVTNFLWTYSLAKVSDAF